MTDKNPRRNEKDFEPHPDPSVTVVNTHLADCFSGVKYRIATHIAIVARTKGVISFVRRARKWYLTVDWRKP